ncbi:MAG: hypothetical protein COB85_07150 [Bacteroidetes bacterium]|nr:MAG: hypothetical protein COB85_07150 [Bacteroidota bacterium]
MSLEILNSTSIFWMLLAAVVFGVLLFVKAPYGRYARGESRFSIDNKLGWVMMEFPSFFIMLYFLVTGTINTYSLFLGILWLAHYFNRSFVFPLRLKTEGKRMSLSIMFLGALFNVVNAGLNGYLLAFISDDKAGAFFAWNFYVGLGLFLLGAWVNISSDNVLLGLRKDTGSSYKIPYGGFYKYVSCPNMLGEIIEWGGFAIMAWNLPALSFFIWTFANLLPRAISHHQWYRQSFEDYPKERKAIFPFVK